MFVYLVIKVVIGFHINMDFVKKKKLLMKQTTEFSPFLCFCRRFLSLSLL